VYDIKTVECYCLIVFFSTHNYVFQKWRIIN